MWSMEIGEAERYCLPQWYLHLVKEYFSTLTVTVSSASAQLRPLPLPT